MVGDQIDEVTFQDIKTGAHMKLNDPFGRLEKRNQASYEMMRDAMQRGGINTVQAAEDIIRQSKSRSIKFLCVTLAVLLLILCLVPKYMPVLACFAVIVIMWTVKSMISGKRYVDRYINEEIQGRAEKHEDSLSG